MLTIREPKKVNPHFQYRSWNLSSSRLNDRLCVEFTPESSQDKERYTSKLFKSFCLTFPEQESAFT